MKSPINHIFYMCGRGDWDNAAPIGYYYDFSKFFIWKGQYMRFVKTLNLVKGSIMKSILNKIKTYIKTQDYAPMGGTISLYTTYGTLKSEKVIRTYEKWANCCFPTSLRLFKEERLIKYV